MLVVMAEYYPFWCLTLSTRCCLSFLWVMGSGFISFTVLVPHDLELASSHLHFFFLLKTCIIKFGLGFFPYCMSIVNFDIFLNGEKKVREFALLCLLNTDTIKASSFQSFPGLITCP